MARTQEPAPRLRDRVRAVGVQPPSRWVAAALLGGAVIILARVTWTARGLEARVLRDVTLFLVGPAALAVAFGGDVGWRIDRRAVRDAVLLAAFVAPFYVVGSALPSIRAYYPMWRTSPALGSFAPHAVQLFVVAFAAETYYRGLLCVGVRELGFRCVFISPVVYAAMHTTKPPIELALSAPTDVLFGAVDYRSGSILPSTVAHGGGLVLLDWLVLHDPVVPPSRVLRWLEWVPVPL